MRLRKAQIRDQIIGYLVAGKSDAQIRREVMDEHKISARQVDRHMVKIRDELEKKGDSKLVYYRQVLLDRYNDQYFNCLGIDDLSKRLKLQKEISDSIARLCNLDKVVGNYTVNILALIPDKGTVQTLKGFGIQIPEGVDG